MEFTSDLSEKMRKYAKEKYDKNITPAEAQEYLRSLAVVYLAFAKIHSMKRSRKESRKRK